MPSLTDLSDAGGWAVFALAVFWVAIAFQRRWIVPGWLYDREVEQRTKAETQAERNAESLAMLAKAAADAHAALVARPTGASHGA